MPLVSSEQLLLDAQSGGYAVGAFNVENLELAQAVIAAAEELRAPVIIQTTPSTVRYAGLHVYHAMVSTLANAATVPVALHLDHGESFEMAVQAIRQGYTSVMIDGSHESFEDNIAVTKRVVDVAKPNGIQIEAELGTIGGKEDDLDGGSGNYTDPAQAAEFAERTGITSLAVAIGTAHGMYQGEPKLDIGRLHDIRKVVSVPLVLHGASGLSEEDVVKCIQEGICKVNYATELRITYSDAVKSLLADKPNTIDPKMYGKAAREKVKELVTNRMLTLGCRDKY